MVSKSNRKAESQKSKDRTAASSKKTQHTKKTVIEPKIQEANNAKSTAPRARSKQTNDPALKTQATKKVKSPNGKASSTKVKPTKQANSKTKVQPTKKAKVAAGKSSSKKNKRTQKLVSQTDIKPTEQPKVSAAKASLNEAKNVRKAKIKRIIKARNSPAKARLNEKLTSFEKKFTSEPKVDIKLGRKPKLNLKPSTVKAAFKKFQSQIVDLKPSTTEKGRASRDYLFEQVQKLVTHFLIPDGYGNWIRTNPKIDAQSITSVNTQHKGELLPVLRLLKYWNERKHKPSLSSYYFETLVVQTFQYAPIITSYPAALEYFFQRCSSSIMSNCPDPKRLGEALDANVSWDTKQKIIKALRNAASHASHAIIAESKNDQKTAIYWWKKVFGSEFPDYG